MLASFALVLALSTQEPYRLSEERRIARVGDLVREAGYALEMDGPGRRSGTVSRGGRRARFRLLGNSYDGSERLGEGAAVLQLTDAFGVARELPQAETPFALGDLIPRGETVFAPNLGRTVEAYADVVLIGEGVAPMVKADLDRYFEGVEAYARANGGTGAPPPPRDWRRRPLSDDLLLHKPDPTSIRRLLRSWGFARPDERPDPMRGEISVWGRVDGLDVALTKLGFASGDHERGVVLSAHVPLPKGADTEAWVRRRAGQAAPLDLSAAGEQGLFVTQEIPLSPPLRTGDLRRRLVAFVRKAESLAR